MKTIIVIPVRMASTRFPNKPLALIEGKPMIQRVWEQAISSNLGEVLVACSEIEVFNIVSSLGGNCIMTDPKLPSGTDRVFAAIRDYSQIDQYDSIINLQGDMPLINSNDIKRVNKPLIQGFDIGTLVTNLSSEDEKNYNITKAKISWIKKNEIGEAVNFYKNSKGILDNIYHHVGIYSFSYSSLEKFIKIPPSTNELLYKLEQLRALDAKMTIGVNYVKDVPISIDTKSDLIELQKIINKNND